MVKKLGLSVMKIDSCRNGCMLYFKDDESLEKCKFYDASKWQASKFSKETRKKVPFARMHYFPLIPRLRRLYASRSSTEHMRWHHVNRREEGLCVTHPMGKLGSSLINYIQILPLSLVMFDWGYVQMV